MAEDTCTCRHCQIRRAAFGVENGDATKAFEDGLAALGRVFGTSLAKVDHLVAIGAIAVFTQTQNEARRQREDLQAATGDVANTKVAGHG